MPTCTVCDRRFTADESARCGACGRPVHDTCREFECAGAVDSWIGALEF